ncbi:hypothetical protein, partial [Streptomyces sp. H27-S2]|uniref:hypothetical protein n=1 Tax=Streptomyces antarcticus TaxID=2996458 RepID=UPI00226F9A82
GGGGGGGGGLVRGPASAAPGIPYVRDARRGTDARLPEPAVAARPVAVDTGAAAYRRTGAIVLSE